MLPKLAPFTWNEFIITLIISLLQRFDQRSVSGTGLPRNLFRQ